jgi:hypothetical protein
LARILERKERKRKKKEREKREEEKGEEKEGTFSNRQLISTHFECKIKIVFKLRHK